MPQRPFQRHCGKESHCKGDIAGKKDYLIGKTKMQLDKQAVKRLEDISKLPEENKSFVLNLIDMALRDFKVKEAHAS